MANRTASWTLFLLGAIPVFGQGTHTSTTSLPPVGLAPSETAQVNVSNIAPNSANGTSASCTGSVAFYNSGGTMIGSASDFTLNGGQTFPVKLPYASVEPTPTSRVVVRATISLTATAVTAAGGGTPALPPPCMLAFSVETYNTDSGVTHVYYAASTPTPVLIGGIATPLAVH